MKGVDILIFSILYFLVFYKKWKSKDKSTLIIYTIMYVYIFGVLYFTLMPILTSLPFIFNHPYVSMNMNLFDDLFNGRGDFLRQIILNIIMMIPFGFLVPLIKEDEKNMFLKQFFILFYLV